MEYDKNKKEDILVSGSIQSGKTNEMLFYCWWSIFVSKRRVVFITRNITADRNQLLERINDFNKRFVRNERLYIKETTPESKKNGIICILANNIQIKNTYIAIKNKKYNLCIDEADLCIKSRNNYEFRLQEYLTPLEKNASHQIGATATEFAVISTKKTLTRLLRMKEPDNYYGVKRIQRRYIRAIEPSTTFGMYEDSNIKPIYDELMCRPSGFRILHTTTKLKIVQANIMTKLRRMYPNMTILTYNGDGSYLFCDNTHDIDNLFVGLRNSHIKRKEDSRGKYLILSKKLQLRDILCEISGHKRICIISGNLASRGLSFVSSDYKVHLTDQYYNPSSYVHGEGLLQGIRLFGCYNDNPELTLWITRTNWMQIREQYKLLKRYISKLKNSKSIVSDIENIKTIFPKKKMSRPGVMRGVQNTITKDGFMKIKIDKTYDYNEN